MAESIYIYHPFIVSLSLWIVWLIKNIDDVDMPTVTETDGSLNFLSLLEMLSPTCVEHIKRLWWRYTYKYYTWVYLTDDNKIQLQLLTFYGKGPIPINYKGIWRRIWMKWTRTSQNFTDDYWCA
jgi:hypothetical protein